MTIGKRADFYGMPTGLNRNAPRSVPKSRPQFEDHVRPLVSAQPYDPSTIDSVTNAVDTSLGVLSHPTVRRVPDIVSNLLYGGGSVVSEGIGNLGAALTYPSASPQPPPESLVRERFPRVPVPGYEEVQRAPTVEPKFIPGTAPEGSWYPYWRAMAEEGRRSGEAAWESLVHNLTTPIWQAPEDPLRRHIDETYRDMPFARFAGHMGASTGDWMLYAILGSLMGAALPAAGTGVAARVAPYLRGLVNYGPLAIPVYYGLKPTLDREIHINAPLRANLSALTRNTPLLPTQTYDAFDVLAERLRTTTPDKISNSLPLPNGGMLRLPKAPAGSVLTRLVPQYAEIATQADDADATPIRLPSLPTISAEYRHPDGSIVAYFCPYINNTYTTWLTENEYAQFYNDIAQSMQAIYQQLHSDEGMTDARFNEFMNTNPAALMLYAAALRRYLKVNPDADIFAMLKKVPSAEFASMVTGTADPEKYNTWLRQLYNYMLNKTTEVKYPELENTYKAFMDAMNMQRSRSGSGR